MTDAHMVEIDLKVFCKIPLTHEEEEYLEINGWEGVKEKYKKNKIFAELERNYNALVRELKKRRNKKC